jgi:hypothetical protein
VRWYLRFCLSFRDLEELMAKRGLVVDHTTIFRWTHTYGSELYRRLHEVKRKSSTWHLDETFVRIAVKWMYLFRAVDCQGQTVDFYFGNAGSRSRQTVSEKGIGSTLTTTTPTCSLEVACGPRLGSRGGSGGVAVSGRVIILITGSNDHRHVKRRLRAMQGPRTTTTAWAATQGIEAAYMIHKGQGLGITRQNLYGQAWPVTEKLGLVACVSDPTAAGLKNCYHRLEFLLRAQVHLI